MYTPEGIAASSITRTFPAAVSSDATAQHPYDFAPTRMVKFQTRRPKFCPECLTLDVDTGKHRRLFNRPYMSCLRLQGCGCTAPLRLRLGFNLYTPPERATCHQRFGRRAGNALGGHALSDGTVQRVVVVHHEQNAHRWSQNRPRP